MSESKHQISASKLFCPRFSSPEGRARQSRRRIPRRYLAIRDAAMSRLSTASGRLAVPLCCPPPVQPLCATVGAPSSGHLATEPSSRSHLGNGSTIADTLHHAEGLLYFTFSLVRSSSVCLPWGINTDPAQNAHFFAFLVVLPIYIIPVTRVNQDHSHSVIQSSIDKTDPGNTFT